MSEYFKIMTAGPEAIEKNPFLALSLLEYIDQVEEISLNFSAEEKGFFENERLQLLIKENTDIKDFSIEKVSVGSRFGKGNISFDGSLDSSLIDAELEVAFANVDVSQGANFLSVIQISTANISLINHGVDEILWEMIGDMRKSDAIREFDVIINDIERNEMLKKNIMESSEAKLLTKIVGEEDPIKAMKIIRDFIINPEKMEIKFEPKEPVGIMDLESKVTRMEWPDDLSITIE